MVYLTVSPLSVSPPTILMRRRSVGGRDLNVELLEAARSGTVAKAQSLIKMGAVVTTIDAVRALGILLVPRSAAGYRVAGRHPLAVVPIL